MGLKADIDEVTKNWQKSPWRIKIFLFISLFLSISSIASLSEAIFKWKGFFLDALIFYREIIINPLSLFLSKILNNPLPGQFLDSSIFLGLFFAGAIRVMLFRQLRLLNKLFDIALLFVAYATMLYLFYNSESTTPEKNSIWLLYPVFLLWFYLCLAGAERILAIAYMVAPLLAIGVFGAISAGLNR